MDSSQNSAVGTATGAATAVAVARPVSSTKRNGEVGSLGAATEPCLEGFVDREDLIEPGEFRTVLAFGIGLTDMAKSASGGDAELPAGADDAAALRRKIEAFRPAILAFVGKRAAQVFLGRAAGYGPQAETIGSTRHYVLPSPSGAARRWWDERWWRELAALSASGR